MNDLSSVGNRTYHIESLNRVDSYAIPRPSPVNGVLKDFSEIRTSTKLWQGGSFKIRPVTSETSKSTFLEKLKSLENGVSGEKIIEDEDPYAFQDVEQPPMAKPREPQRKEYAPQTQMNKGLYKFAAQNAPNRIGSEKQMGIIRSTVPVFSVSTSSENCLPSVRQSDILPRHALEAAKVRSPLFTSIKTAQSPPNAKMYQMQVLKSNANTKTTNSQRSISGGKPLNFGKSQMSKLAIAKIEKTIENRNKNVIKGKPSLQKTVSISKLMTKPKRLPPIRSASLDSDVLLNNHSASRLKASPKKSLLEESLLGIKPPDADRSRVVATVTKTCVQPVPPVQTAATTVNVPPRTRPHMPCDRLLKHESLQRIWNVRNKIKLLKRNYQQFGLLLGGLEEQNIDTEGLIFRNYWFSLCNDYDSFDNSTRKRDAKLARLKTELRHKLRQQQWRFKNEYRDNMSQLLINTARHRPNLAAFLIRLETASQRTRNNYDRLHCQLDQPGLCEYLDPKGVECSQRAVPCAKYCRNHIVHNMKQMLFSPCTVPVPPDNSLCGAPVLDKIGDLGLCVLHERLESHIQKPKKIAADKVSVQVKKNRSSLSSSRSGRSRKRKRHSTREKKECYDSNAFNRTDVDPIRHRLSNALIVPRIHPMHSNELIISKSDVDETQDVEVGEEVLAISSELPLDSAELATLATTATKLLEEHDFSNVLSHIPEFNDLFAGDKEEFGPTPQETEELERALEAVDKDVKSLSQSMSQQAILEMLDDETLAQTIVAALPEVVPVLYNNGFTNLGQLDPSLCNLHPDVSTVPLPTLPAHADLLQS